MMNHLNNHIQVVCFGEVLWDNLREGRRLGGAPLNVCYHLNKLGVSSAIVSQVGNDQNGKDLLKEIDALEIDRSYCTITDDYPTSTVEVHIEQQQVEYEIVEEVAWDYIPYSASLENLVSNADVLLFGSLVTRHEVSRNTLLQLLPKAVTRVFDVNLRPPFYERERILSLLSVTTLLKLNEDEVVILSAWLNITATDEKEILKAILNHFPDLEEVILTRGARGASYCSRSEYYSVPARKIVVQDTVGSGDAFLAAFLAGKMQGRPVKERIERAIALSGFIASKPGACPPYQLAEVVM